MAEEDLECGRWCFLWNPLSRMSQHRYNKVDAFGYC
ncbi:unnamed protein product [Brassica rapa subsp. narinosa]